MIRISLVETIYMCTSVRLGTQAFQIAWQTVKVQKLACAMNRRVAEGLPDFKHRDDFPHLPYVRDCHHHDSNTYCQKSFGEMAILIVIEVITNTSLKRNLSCKVTCIVENLHKVRSSCQK